MQASKYFKKSRRVAAKKAGPQKKKVVLFDIQSPALIVKAKTGLVYQHQTGGVLCHHPEQEGFLVPLGIIPKYAECQVFDPDYWYKEMPLLDDALYNRLEEALNGSFQWHAKDIQVERDHPDNEEAWIHVKFKGTFRDENPPNLIEDDDLLEYEGILVWENCD